uniref:Uncharacterized protein n=1 Tax=Quercus lobata TaxID=97700 RepID=A0A7N2LA87_QUELO
MPPLPSYGYGREHPGPRYGSLVHGQNLKDVVITVCNLSSGYYLLCHLHNLPLVGLKLYSASWINELLGTEIVDQDGKSSLLSLVKAFDSVFDVYEGFCNLKQVDLKLKICRGTSNKKILVREAQSYSAATVIVGTGTEDHHRNGLLRMIQETLKKNTKVPNEGNASVSLKERFENGT